MSANTKVKIQEPTKNFMRNLIVDNYLSNAESLEGLIYKGFEGLFNMSDEQLIEEIADLGFQSVEEFEQNYASELGLGEQ